MLHRVVDAVGGELTLDAVSRAAESQALGVSALDHEAGNHPVENQSVIKAAVCQGDKIPHGLGRRLGIQLAFHLSSVAHRNGKNRILRHECASFSEPFGFIRSCVYKRNKGYFISIFLSWQVF